MSYELKGGNGGDMKIYLFNFSPLLVGAIQYGWEPMGAWMYHEYGNTSEERSMPGSIKSYLGNDFQGVDEEDAKNLAVALQKALDDDYDFSIRDESDLKLEEDLNLLLDSEGLMKPTQPSLPERKQHMRDLARQFIKFIETEKEFYISWSKRNQDLNL